MSRSSWHTVAGVVIGICLLVILMGWPVSAEKLAGVTNLDQLFLRASSTTPVLKVNQVSTGDIVQFQDNGSTVWKVADGGAVTASGETILSTWGRFTAQTSITVTMNGYITPTGTYQPIAADGDVGTSNLAAGTAGQLLVLINTSDTTITITDTGTLKLSADAALTQHDALTLLSDGTNWIELSKSTN